MLRSTPPTPTPIPTVTPDNNDDDNDTQIIDISAQDSEDEAQEELHYFVYTGQVRHRKDLDHLPYWIAMATNPPITRTEFYYQRHYFIYDTGRYLTELSHDILRRQEACHICLEDTERYKYFAPACGHIICHLCKYRKLKRNDITCGLCRKQIEIYYAVDKLFFPIS